jgi:septum formation protein
MNKPFILASESPFRARMLSDAGLDFDTDKASIDERAIEASLAGSGTGPEDLAAILAEAKAMEVSGRHPGRLVIGCDQTLSIDERVLHKPADMDEARRRLLLLSGHTHRLSSAVAAVRDGETVWRHVSTADLTMRELDPGFVGRHLAKVGDRALTSVGAYQVEREGIQLFERIDGDHFTIVGLPMLPLLAFLREQGVIDG